MSIMDNTISVDGYKGLFIKNSVGLKEKKLTKSNYKKFNKEIFLQFVMQVTKPKRKRLKLTPVKLVGTTVENAIRAADAERSQIVKDLLEGKPSGKIVGIITIEDLWKEYTEDRVNSQNMTMNYPKDKASFFDKHLRSVFMPYKMKTEKVKIILRKDGKFCKRTEMQEMPIVDKDTGKPIINKDKLVDIRNITEDMLQKVLVSINMGCYRRRRRCIDKAKKRNVVYFDEIKYKPASAHQFIKVFNAMFEFAVKRKYIDINPMKDLASPKYKNARDFTVPPDRAKALYNTLINYPEIKFRAIFIFLLNGRRKNEVLSLTWNDVDLEQKKYYVRYYFNKNKEEYEYELPDNLHGILLDMYHEYKKQPKVENDYVFTSSKTGGKINNFDKRWNSIINSVGIIGVTRHDLRHWLGNVAINMGKTTAEVAYMLGHSDERTAKRYSKIRPHRAGKTVSDVHSAIKE